MQEYNIRKPVVAGQFYPSSKEKLRLQIESLIDKKANKEDALACMLPHAGYMYSGRVAGETLSHINIKNKVILLGPNHTGDGAAFSIMTQGAWLTPMGQVKIDTQLANHLLEKSEYLKEDSLAHLNEHSLEVELPFLQYFKDDFQIVPIAFMSQDIAALKKAGEEIAAVVNTCADKSSIMLVASSDMTHYEPEEIAHKKDKEAIGAILELDEDKLIDKIRCHGITMCGYAPVVVMLKAAKLLGAKNAKLIKYRTSGEVTGDTESVVGYAGITIY